MPDRKLRELCSKIGTEKDPDKLTALVDELANLVRAEYKIIKAKLQAETSRNNGHS
jgi:hypothetical protein